LLGIEPVSPEFPIAVGSTLDRLKETMTTVKDKAELSKKMIAWFERILSLEELDPGIQTVIRHSIQKLD